MNYCTKNHSKSLLFVVALEMLVKKLLENIYKVKDKGCAWHFMVQAKDLHLSMSRFYMNSFFSKIISV